MFNGHIRLYNCIHVGTSQKFSRANFSRIPLDRENYTPAKNTRFTVYFTVLYYLALSHIQLGTPNFSDSASWPSDWPLPASYIVICLCIPKFGGPDWENGNPLLLPLHNFLTKGSVPKSWSVCIEPVLLKWKKKTVLYWITTLWNKDGWNPSLTMWQ